MKSSGYNIDEAVDRFLDSVDNSEKKNWNIKKLNIVFLDLQNSSDAIDFITYAADYDF